MPLLRIFKHDDATIGLWKMEEGEFDSSCNAYLHEVLNEAREMFKSNMRRMEYVCERALLMEMMNGRVVEITHNRDGKPMLFGCKNISISHTKGYVSIILSATKRVGIDIEFVSNRVEKIAKRFMRDDESAHDTRSLLLHWCAKETIYKLFSSDHLDFMDIKVNAGECVTVTNLRDNITLPLYVENTDTYVLTYAMS